MTSTAGNHLTEDTDPLCLPPARAAALLRGAPWRRFAVVGDSLAAGTGDPSPGYAPGGWPGRVVRALRRADPDLVHLATARPGATAAGTLAAQTGPMAAFRPDLVHLSCGANDLFRPEPDFAALERTLRRVFALAADTGARLTTFTLGRAFTVPGFPDWPARVRALNDLTRDVARDHGAVLVDMWDHPVNARPGLLGADGIHFAAAGQAVLAAEVVRALARLPEVRG
ncbi:SGNH/GDSL hydrolase family protein [Streptomyces capparidis]